MPKFSLAITTYNRYNFIEKDLGRYIENKFINEIVINDDSSDDYSKLQKFKNESSKLKLFRNEFNLGVIKNKIKTISLSSNEFVLLLDSDNSISDKVLE